MSKRPKNCGCDCDGGSPPEPEHSGSVISTSVLQGHIYAPIYISAYQIAVEHGFEGTIEEWLASLKGDPGKSAYEVAVDEGFVGTVDEWLESLIGPPGPQGPDGKSAYQIAVEHGYKGTEQEWIDDIISKGTSDHSLLKNRDLPDSHPISAIQNLPTELNDLHTEINGKQDTVSVISEQDVRDICV